MSLKSTIAGALLSLCLVSPALAAPSFGPSGFGPRPIAYGGHRQSTWELIGAREVSFRANRDTIFARGNDRQRQIMICVYRQPVRMLDVDVRFSNGGHQDLNVRNVIGEGQCTRAMDLRGHRRDIRSITLNYKSIGGHRFGGRFAQTALVKVFAR